MRKENENENEKKEGKETYAFGHKDFSTGRCYRPVLKDLSFSTGQLDRY